MFCETLLLACFQMALPPVKYDYEPTIPYEIVELPKKQVVELCGSWGCVLGRETKVIIVVDDLPYFHKNIVIKHEKAHLNGWAADHQEIGP